MTPESIHMAAPFSSSLCLFFPDWTPLSTSRLPIQLSLEIKGRFYLSHRDDWDVDPLCSPELPSGRLFELLQNSENIIIFHSIDQKATFCFLLIEFRSRVNTTSESA
ncbi:hypothetical protein LWI28_009744 [Acer negundo]|uniref:Uncharacterized protein n=1 Tax=Acer negundo TaxID=4023 RepID=A0AAD5I903_ACENE|nr:hypothetical protein LWI28_009744 [Acer negundo]